MIRTCLNMRPALLQRIFLVALALAPWQGSAGELQPGAVRTAALRDVDGKTHSTAGGHVSIIVVITRQNEAKARAVADRVPESLIGNPKFPFLTVINFQGRIFGPLQGLTRRIIRTRLDAEAERLRPQYTARHLGHDPRQDIFVVADFDGSAVEQLGLASASTELAVLIFNAHGKLIAHWNDVPTEAALARALSAAE